MSLFNFSNVSSKDWLWNIRMFLVRKLVGKAQVMLNMTIDCGTVMLSSERKFYSHDCVIIRSKVAYDFKK